MRGRTSCLALLLAAGVALVPAARGQEPADLFPVLGEPLYKAPIFRCQDYAPPEVVLPLPIWHDRPEKGGLYMAYEFLFMRQTNPLRHQVIAVRGIEDTDGSITRDLTGTLVVNADEPPFIIPGTPAPGTFYGSQAPALNADDASGPATYQPGFSIALGWKFQNGVVVEITWWHLVDAKYAAGASVLPPDRQLGNLLQESFLFSPVFGFPPEYAGPAEKVAFGDPLAAYGIWNGANVMTIHFVQRFDQFELTGRIPITESDSNRVYGLIGPRLVWIWERFKWRTVAASFDGTAGQETTALYSNIVSNRMYGVHLGCGNEYRLGDTPIGTFSFSLDLQAAILINVVKERAKYERGDFLTSSKRARTEYVPVPELQAQINFWYYPIEGIQMRFGWDFMGFFNTVAAPKPVSFDYHALDPPWEKNRTRWFDGFHAGIGIIF